jgi:hypothetical protein
MSQTASSVPRNIGESPREDAVRNHYRYPHDTFDIQPTGTLSNRGFFRFGSATCFGACSLPDLPSIIDSSDTRLPVIAAALQGESVRLPFDPAEVADHLRMERYTHLPGGQPERLLNSAWIRRGYYSARRFMPVGVRKRLQRLHLANWRDIPFPEWPLDCSVDLMFEQILRVVLRARIGTAIPFVWFWPNGHLSCLIMTHDVEQAAGRDFCSTLMEIDESAGLRSSFQIIPEGRYEIAASFLDEIRNRGHEINVHDLNHDGYLFQEREEFLRRAQKIRAYARQFSAEGFRSAVLYRNLEWFDRLEVSYDMSVPNVAHLDPQRGGCCTVMPYFIGRVLELPLTATQDYSLFHILGDYSLRLWEQQIQGILEHNGLLSFNVHPDYIMEKRALGIYNSLLSRIAALRAQSNVWAALPREVNRWWRQRSQMQLVPEGDNWRIVGEGSERARVAWATVDNDRLVYDLDS